ncbi:MAG: hypothetical protein IJ003_00575 [Candidatus Gastranaerophilales bacterium]|nr:hypothetical protein [Candidatus Gastranaerophilales bacterium]
MSEEIKIDTNKECFCKSKGFRSFLVVSLGSFVGVFCALSLFAALHKPPMMHHGFGPKFHHYHHHAMMKHHKDCNCPYHKKFQKHPEEFKKQFDKKEIKDKD